jgi:hypothetical protein
MRPLGDRFHFQRQHATGRVINVGCSGNAGGIKALHVDQLAGPFVDGPRPEPFLQADARSIPVADNSFDTIILGDILEHFETEDEAIKCLKEAHRIAKKLVLTVPRDDGICREAIWECNLMAPGSHRLWVDDHNLWRWLEAANWEVAIWIEADYGMTDFPCGWFIVAYRRNAQEWDTLRATAPWQGRIKPKCIGMECAK